MKRVLIIAYYWPPSAGSGVQRWLKFAKYLSQYDWQPVIYTPENPDFSQHDNELLKEIPSTVEVIKNPIWEPYHLKRTLLGGKQDDNASNGLQSAKGGFKSYLANWIRGNLFIPDPKIFWRKPSEKFLKKYLIENPVDAIVSTGTPHSMHLIAYDLKKKFSLPWLADFRDPWTELDMLQDYHILPFRMKKYRALEKLVLKTADVCTTTSNTWAEAFTRLGAKRVEVVTNGFDESDFELEVTHYEEFVISHFGLLNHLRNPATFWKALDELCYENEEFFVALRVHLGGTIATDNLELINQYPKLKTRLKVFPYLSHEEVIKEYLRSSVLLLLLFNSESGIGNIPGKLFEYLAAGVSIIAFGPGKGDSKQIIEELNTGIYFDYKENDTQIIKDAVLRAYRAYKEQGSREESPKNNAYTRRNLTARLSGILNEITD